MRRRFLGGCHCGESRIAFDTARPLAPRACGCGFCRRHGARTVTDPDGAAELRLGPAAILYRFATRSTDYWLCGRCGIYLGAAVRIDGADFATLNLNAFEDPRLDLAAIPVSYEGEIAEAKRDRRRQAWTPARLEGR
jgi:hypothetical protein